MIKSKKISEAVRQRRKSSKSINVVKHKFAQLPFKSDLINLELYLNKMISSGIVPSWEDPISPAPNSRSIKEVFVSLNKQVDATNEIFKNIDHGK